MIVYQIVAIPRPQGSKRHVGHGIMIESSKHIKNWRAFARVKAEQAMAGHNLIDKPNAVCIGIIFAFDRPKKHFLKSGLRLDAPDLHTGTPDSDKLQRALFDSMTGIVFRDDSQVANVIATKRYGMFAQTLVLAGTESEWPEISNNVLHPESILASLSKNT